MCKIYSPAKGGRTEASDAVPHFRDAADHHPKTFNLRAQEHCYHYPPQIPFLLWFGYSTRVFVKSSCHDINSKRRYIEATATSGAKPHSHPVCFMLIMIASIMDINHYTILVCLKKPLN